MRPASVLLLLLAVGLVLLMVAGGAIYTVSETEQVILTQFGKPVGEPVTTAGLYFKVPFMQDVNRIDKRILEWDGASVEMPTKDKTYISVDTFARWRIVQPLEYYRRLRDERSAQSRLEDILGSETRNAIANHKLIEVIRTTPDRQPLRSDTLDAMGDGGAGIGMLHDIEKGRRRIEREVLESARSKLAEFGIDLLDLRFKRVNYNASVVESIYQRMVSERQQIASLFRSEGEGEAAKILGSRERDLAQIESAAYKAVQEIEGQADAEASAIYAAAYGQSAEARELYTFLQTMDTYRKVLGADTSFVLTTKGDFLRFLESPTGGGAQDDGSDD